MQKQQWPKMEKNEEDIFATRHQEMIFNKLAGARLKHFEPKRILEVLQDKDLIGNMIKNVQRRAVGEYGSIFPIIVFKCGAFVKNCKKTSFNLFVSDQSGVGKDF